MWRTFRTRWPGWRSPIVLELTAAQIAAGCASGGLDPGEVLAVFQKRIEERNPELNAVVGEVPASLASDLAVLRQRIARGERLPLAGVPVVVKDVIWVSGERVTQGSLLFRDFVAPQDAVAVERLRQAGALVIGMGNSSEFACKGLTTNKVYGLTRHHLDPTLTPGGSSGGCAVAVADRMAPLALGTDGGGSSRRPPAHAGVVGFKPSFGAIPDPIGFAHAFNGLQVMAPITRTVEDARLMFEAMAGADPRDPQSIDLPRGALRPSSQLRIAFSPRLGLQVPVDADVKLPGAGHRAPARRRPGNRASRSAVACRRRRGHVDAPAACRPGQPVRRGVAARSFALRPRHCAPGRARPAMAWRRRGART